MEAFQLEAIDQALLVISEARERTEAATRVLGESDRGRAALVAAERALMSTYNELWRAVYFPFSHDEQLRLAG
jgi:hypothetical protein